MNWRCPDCGGSKLVEITINPILTTEINTDYNFLDWGTSYMDGGYVQYECAKCHYVLPVDSEEELEVFLFGEVQPRSMRYSC
jgi:rubredoxin